MGAPAVGEVNIQTTLASAASEGAPDAAVADPVERNADSSVDMRTPSPRRGVLTTPAPTSIVTPEH